MSSVPYRLQHRLSERGLFWRAVACALLALPANCGPQPPLPLPGAIATTLVVAVADTGWHTDVCLRREDAGAWLDALPRDPAGIRFLCFGFGDEEYMVAHDHSVLAKLRSMLPSEAAIVMTPLRDDPAAFFGAENVVPLGISRAGADGLAGFIRASMQADAAGHAAVLGDGPVPGRIFFSATARYSGLNTCNTWTGNALHAAGLPVRDGALFASDILDQVKPLAAAQAKAALGRASAAPAAPEATRPASAGSP